MVYMDDLFYNNRPMQGIGGTQGVDDSRNIENMG